jgi:AmmeMemoRadiSam system protein A
MDFIRRKDALRALGAQMIGGQAMKTIYLPLESQRKLIELSRRILEDFVRGQARRAGPIDDSYLESDEYGAFVSLHNRGELRGCIGDCAPRTPLYETVIEMTEAAASRDSRVEPIAKDELQDLVIDISVLSPLVKTQDPLSLEVGKHGLYVAQRGRRGVLLPQVATQYHWDIQTFLEQTCLKAGLRKHAWKDSETEVSVFTALIIEERR